MPRRVIRPTARDSASRAWQTRVERSYLLSLVSFNICLRTFPDVGTVLSCDRKSKDTQPFLFRYGSRISGSGWSQAGRLVSPTIGTSRSGCLHVGYLLGCLFVDKTKRRQISDATACVKRQEVFVCRINKRGIVEMDTSDVAIARYDPYLIVTRESMQLTLPRYRLTAAVISLCSTELQPWSSVQHVFT